MKPKTKRRLKKLVSWLGLFFFAAASYAIYAQLSKYSMDDIKNSLMRIPNKNLVYAGIASFLGYLALSSYDFLALRYIKRKISPLKWIFAGFIGFAVSNNAGHAVVSGGTIRYRLYICWRFQASEIVRMVTFSGFTYLIACFFLIIVGYILTPSHAFGDQSTSKIITIITVIFSIIGLCVYFGASLFYKKPIMIKEISFNIPSFRLALAQMVFGSADILMASSVLYFALAPFVDIQFDVFIGVFIIAQVLGAFSPVPGGLGVFEGLFLYILPGETDAVHIFGALIAYRVIYYLLPLVISGILLISYERWLANAKKKIKLTSKSATH